MDTAQSTTRQSSSGLIKLTLKGCKGNRRVVRDLLTNIRVGDYVSIMLKSGTEVTGPVLNLFYPIGDAVYCSSRLYTFDGKSIPNRKTLFGVKIGEAQAEEVAHYRDILSFEVRSGVLV